METKTLLDDNPVEETQAVSLEELKVDVWEAALFKGEAMDAAHKFDKALNAYRETAVKDERAKIAYKGQLTKVKRKVANGSCPCCMRHFTDLQRHMQTKHPEYVAESNEEASPCLSPEKS